MRDSVWFPAQNKDKGCLARTVATAVRLSFA